ncbi:MAG: hypothetical protein M1831_006775 [Alyxoria varia]|nr:MAG: hypothetical protein M1831_006775 [Alyxoria varia]
MPPKPVSYTQELERNETTHDPTDSGPSHSQGAGLATHPPLAAPTHGNTAHLIPPQVLQRMVGSWLEEDAPGFDYGGFVVGEGRAEARLLGKSMGILAGVPFFNEVFRQLGCEVYWFIPESHTTSPQTRKHIATVHGPVRSLLLGERVALNLLARCSGIATKTSHTLHLLRDAGYPNALAGTRKTTPGFRIVEKYGMLVGGADTHRYDLSSMVMLKDNHVTACAGNSASMSNIDQATTSSQSSSSQKQTALLAAIPNAVRTARSAAGFSLKIEVECSTPAQAEAAIQAGADVVMLDNFPAPEIGGIARMLKERWHAGHPPAADVEASGDASHDAKAGRRREFLIEVSGGLTEENIAAYASEYVDVVSTSSIHQGVPHLDFSLKVVGGGAASESSET